MVSWYLCWLVILLFSVYFVCWFDFVLFSLLLLLLLLLVEVLDPLLDDFFIYVVG